MSWWAWFLIGSVSGNVPAIIIIIILTLKRDDRAFWKWRG